MNINGISAGFDSTGYIIKTDDMLYSGRNGMGL